MIEEIIKELKSHSDEKYKSFSSSLLPGINNILGVRLPILRKIAKKIIKSNANIFLKENNNKYFELLLLEAMVIPELNLEFNELLVQIDKFIPKINSWSVCDCFCANLKVFKSNLAKTKNYIEKFLNSENEYELRFYYVILLTYFIENDIEYVLNAILQFNNEKYYAKMAVAWCLSICFVKNYNQTLDFIKNNKIHPWVLKKGINKAIESLRLTKDEKDNLKEIRKNLEH